MSMVGATAGVRRPARHRRPQLPHGDEDVGRVGEVRGDAAHEVALDIGGGAAAGLHGAGEGKVEAAVGQDQDLAVERAVLEHLDGENVARIETIAALSLGRAGQELHREEGREGQEDHPHLSVPMLLFPGLWPPRAASRKGRGAGPVGISPSRGP